MRFYFDHNACTPVDPRVLQRFVEIETAFPGNPSSLHSAGRRARGVVEDARDEIAEHLGLRADHVFFVSGGTEANNTMVLGGGDPARPVLCAPLEHPSILAAAEHRGVAWWDVDSEGTVRVDRPERPVGLLAIVHGQSEVGTLQPIDAACELAESLGVPIHVDASQTLGRCPLDIVLARATSVTLSTHKAAGLRGIGVLIDKRPDTRPLLRGGGQQRDRRSGTESPALAAATALAVKLAITEQVDRARAMEVARTAFADALRFEGAHRITPARSLPNTLLYQFDHLDGRELLPALDMAGVEASQGSACSSGSPTPPRVLEAMGMSPDAAQSCVRFSFAATTTSEEAQRGGSVVRSVVSRLQSR